MVTPDDDVISRKAAMKLLDGYRLELIRRMNTRVENDPSRKELRDHADAINWALEKVSAMPAAAPVVPSDQPRFTDEQWNEWVEEDARLRATVAELRQKLYIMGQESMQADRYNSEREGDLLEQIESLKASPVTQLTREKIDAVIENSYGEGLTLGEIVKLSPYRYATECMRRLRDALLLAQGDET